MQKFPVLERSGAAAAPEEVTPVLPDYLVKTYHWTYLCERNVRLLDRELVVSFILWGRHRRLRDAAFAEFVPGQQVLQAACVYGDFSVALADHLGPGSRLDVIDIAPLQVERCRRKLSGLGQARVRRADAAVPVPAVYDAVCCYFLLHELPDGHKTAVVDALLGSVKPGGRVVFVDYDRPHWGHPLKLVMSTVFDTLEPFAKGLWEREIEGFATDASPYSWTKRRYFGGLYQKVVARRPS